MKLSWILPALSLALPAYTQTIDLSGLPACAQGPAQTGITASGCALSDLKCICASQQFLQIIANKVHQVCSQADIAATDAFAEKLCGTLDIPLSITGSLPVTTTAGKSGASGAVEATTASSAASTTASAATPSQFSGAAERIGAGGLIGAIVLGAALIGM